MPTYPLKPCPICAKDVTPPAENRWFPFCSNRCKTVDLGKWLSGEYRVPGRDVDEGERGSGSGDGGGGGPIVH